ncbi:hypothetical protein ASG06_18115 [Rathayibacter sp. Leaf185]|nr:hypothetical protein ASF42_17380 [Rathayibacter sp. Leaf294]KQS07137.1 hypothetical protein ASG06_18115 [Rathayibacter sp. Leaf185]
MTFFFILSGFVLAWSHRRSVTPVTFYRRRLSRIYPVYAVTLLAGVAAKIATDPAALSDGILTPVLLQAWLPDHDVILAINVPAWSLSCEAFFYLVFPLVIRPVVAMRSRARWLMAAASAAGVLLVGVVGSFVSGTGRIGDSEVADWLVGYLPLARLPEFFLGVVFAVALRKGEMPRIPLALAGGLSVGALAFASATHSLIGVAAAPVLAFGLLIVSAAQSDLDGRGRWLRHPVLVRLGAWSYSFYLVHVLAMGAVSTGSGMLGLATRGPTVILLVFAVSLASAGLLHAFVERPADRLLNGRSARSVVADA